MLDCAIIYIYIYIYIKYSLLNTRWIYHLKTILQMGSAILLPLGSESLNIHRNGLVGVCVSLISFVHYLGSGI